MTTGERLVYDLDAKTAVVESGGTQQRVKGLFIPGSGGGESKPAAAPAPSPAPAAKPARPAGTPRADAAPPRRTQ